MNPIGLLGRKQVVIKMRETLVENSFSTWISVLKKLPPEISLNLRLWVKNKK